MSGYREPSPREHWTLGEIESEIRRLAVIVGAREDDLPTFDQQDGYSGRPNIEPAPWSPGGFAYVSIERGQENERSTFTTVDDLLFRVFDSVTFDVACRYELAHRVPDEDCRRMLFAKQVELLERLSPAWGQRGRERKEAILREHPFDDAATVRGRSRSR